MRIVSDNPERGRYEVAEDGKVLGVLEYRRLQGAVALDYVEVEPEFRGQGLSDLLISKAVAAIRSEGLDIEPMCPVVVDWLARQARST